MTGQKNISLGKTETSNVLGEYLTKARHALCRQWRRRSLGQPVQGPHEPGFAKRILHPGSPRSPIHRIPFPIPFLPYVAPHGGTDALAWVVNGRIVAYYHPGDIGDAWADDHAGVPAQIWEACYQLGTNVIFYGHTEYSKWLESPKKIRLIPRLAVLFAIFLSPLSEAARLDYLEQMPLEAFAKLREIEKHQLKIAEKFYLKGEHKAAAAAEYDKFLTL